MNLNKYTQKSWPFWSYTMAERYIITLFNTSNFYSQYLSFKKRIRPISSHILKELNLTFRGGSKTLLPNSCIIYYIHNVLMHPLIKLIFADCKNLMTPCGKRTHFVYEIILTLSFFCNAKMSRFSVISIWFRFVCTQFLIF